MTDPVAFGTHIREAATAAGYDLTSPRSGGRTLLAQDTGLATSTVSRMLNGRTIPEATAMEPLARVLDLNIGDLIERALGLTPGTLTGPRPAKPRTLLPKEAAARLGIKDPRNVEVFTALVTALRDTEPRA
ncbi:helix-turn-helix domain-containing protein [Streptomyces chumphonensis]|uniref:helix-turn-helix domain-containing protein n=1 Tax=Streptomyces chumphonensis TaxID=1214925 RepID=UPI003D74C81A